MAMSFIIKALKAQRQKVGEICYPNPFKLTIFQRSRSGLIAAPTGTADVVPARTTQWVANCAIFSRATSRMANELDQLRIVANTDWAKQTLQDSLATQARVLRQLESSGHFAWTDPVVKDRLEQIALGNFNDELLASYARHLDPETPGTCNRGRARTCFSYQTR